jgi:pyruvate dehydrogenase E2 component (dihydrolipoamide acetyltransferase)
MIIKVLVPQAFENMEEATIGAWLKAEGDLVHEGDALCELITEKTTFELPAEGMPASGVLLRRIMASEKSIVPVGVCIALLGSDGEELPDVEAENARVLARRQAESTTPSTPALQVPVADATAVGPSTSRLRATPAARRAARERGLALEDVAVAYPGKVLTEDDVANFSA